MSRWLILLLLALAGPGCALIDDYDDAPTTWAHESPAVSVQQPTCGSGVVPAAYNQAQTSEPPR